MRLQSARGHHVFMTWDIHHSITRSAAEVKAPHRPSLTKARSSGWADKPTKRHRRSQLSLWAQGPCKARSCPPVFYDHLPHAKPRGDCGTPGPQAGPYLGVLCTHQHRSGETRAHWPLKLLTVWRKTPDSVLGLGM